MNIHLETLNEISILLNKSTENIDFEKIMYRFLEILANKVGMQRGMISIYRQDLEEIHVEVTYGIPEKRDRIFYRLGEGVTGTVVATGRPIAIPNLNQEPLFLDKSGARRSLINRSELAFLCVPIKYGDNVVGALSVDRVLEGTDLQYEVDFLQIVANLIASKVHIRKIIEENIKLRQTISQNIHASPIIGNCDLIKEVIELIDQVADTNSTVLITGETGTGKGLIASEIHNKSSRSKFMLVKINCGAIPENLMENELFGHEKGAFTGAIDKKKGKFEIANNGTIFLDEIGELPIFLQVKLLKILEDRSFERIGGTETIKTNVRIIAATNKDLEREIAEKKFRSDLYYRLNVFPIHLPPLRERGSDIVLLTDHFIHNIKKELKKEIKGIDNLAMEILTSYNWPGNVRELQNCIERSALITKDGIIKIEDLPPSIKMGKVESCKRIKGTFDSLVSLYEKSLILEALRESKGNQTKAAKILGTTKRIIQYKIKNYQIDCRKIN